MRHDSTNKNEFKMKCINKITYIQHARTHHGVDNTDMDMEGNTFDWLSIRKQNNVAQHVSKSWDQSIILHCKLTLLCD